MNRKSVLCLISLSFSVVFLARAMDAPPSSPFSTNNSRRVPSSSFSNASNMQSSSSSSSSQSFAQESMQGEGVEDLRQSLNETNRLLFSIQDLMQRTAILPEQSERSPALIEQSPITVPDDDLCEELIATAPVELSEIALHYRFALDKNPNIRRFVGGKLPKLMLFVGSPGLGKTSTAIALSKILERRCIFRSGAALCNEYKNSGITNLNQLFQPVITTDEPCVIILDELTGLTDHYKNERDADAPVVSYLWTLFDRCKSKDIIIVGTTNDPSKLPAALMDRFRANLIVKFSVPDEQARVRSLNFYLNHEAKSGNADVQVINEVDEATINAVARETYDFSTRKLEGLVAKSVQIGFARAMNQRKNGPGKNDSPLIIRISNADLKIALAKEIAGRPSRLARLTSALIYSWPYIQSGMQLGYTALNLYMQISQFGAARMQFSDQMVWQMHQAYQAHEQQIWCQFLQAYEKVLDIRKFKRKKEEFSAYYSPLKGLKYLLSCQENLKETFTTQEISELEEIVEESRKAVGLSLEQFNRLHEKYKTNLMTLPHFASHELRERSSNFVVSPFRIESPAEIGLLDISGTSMESQKEDLIPELKPTENCTNASSSQNQGEENPGSSASENTSSTSWSSCTLI